MAHAGHAGEPLAAFDVAEDMSRFVFAAAPVFDDGMPAYGNAFITQGYIYPAGTLDGGVEGTLPNGEPAFPDLVIGEWTCNGYFVGDGMRTETGAIVMTRQIMFTPAMGTAALTKYSLITLFHSAPQCSTALEHCGPL